MCIGESATGAVASLRLAAAPGDVNARSSVVVVVFVSPSLNVGRASLYPRRCGGSLTIPNTGQTEPRSSSHSLFSPEAGHSVVVDSASQPIRLAPGEGEGELGDVRATKALLCRGGGIARADTRTKLLQVGWHGIRLPRYSAMCGPEAMDTRL